MYYPLKECTYIIIDKRVNIMAYSKKSQADYKKKIKQFKVQYNLQDNDDGLRFQKYLKETGQSANGYLKELIKKDMDSKGIELWKTRKNIIMIYL